MATQLGARTSTDAYYLALSIPVIVYAVLLVAVKMGGIPNLTAIANEERRSLSQAASELVTATAAGATLLSVILTVSMMVLLPAAAGGSTRFQELTRQFLVELSPYAVTGALLGAMGAVLAVRGSFVIATAVLGIEPVLKTLLVVLFHHQLGVQALVIGNLVGNAFAVLILWRALSRAGVSLRPVAFGHSQVVRRIFRLSGPLVLSSILLQLNPLIDRATAAAVGPGSVTVFELGVRLFNAPMALVSASLIAPLAATWSERYIRDGWSAVTGSFSRGLSTLVVVAIPLVAIGFLARHDLVEFAYSSHAYSRSSVDRTASVLGALLLGLVPQIMVLPLSTLFLVRKDTVFPLKVGIANCTLNAALDLALRGPLGVTGIAASTTITLTFLCGVYVWKAQRRWGEIGLAHFRTAAAIATVSCGLIVGAGAALTRVLPAGTSRWHALASGSAIVATGAAILGALLLYCRRVPALRWMR
ncbi:MAG TPA: lipid II flippase MurJ [Solirubrobacteraceae bacterium]|nr:lipid II flippase MurJ [Solirubrobacteraceae bacterium]